MKPSEFIPTAAEYMKAGLPLLVVSIPGAGKSDTIKEAVKLAGIKRLYTMILSTADPTDLKGLGALVKTDKGIQAEFLTFGDYQKLIDADEPTVCFFDDIGQAAASVQAPAMQLLRARECNGRPISPFVTFIAASNRREDKAGVNSILEPVKSRFATILELEPDLDDLCRWLLRSGFDPILPAFLRFRPDYVNNFKPTTDMTNSSCPRTIEHVGHNLRMSMTDANRFECIKGAAGEAFAIEFIGFMETVKSLPNIDAILLNPEKAPLPDPDQLGRKYTAVMYALASVLVKRADKSTIDAIYRYALRLPAEYSMLIGVDLESFFPECIHASERKSWISRHGEDQLIN